MPMQPYNLYRQIDNRNMTYKKISLPDYLSEQAENYIKRVIDFLKKQDKLNEIDNGILWILADSYHQILVATDDVNKHGLTIEGSRNSRVVNPAVRISKDNRSLCLSIMEQMGMTLKSRAKMNVMDSDNEKSPLENFLLND